MLFALFCVGTTSLCVEALLQRSDGSIMYATPVFALVVPLGGFGGALPPLQGAATVFCSLAAVQVGAFVIAGDMQTEGLWSTHAELVLSGPALFLAWLSVLACWTGSMVHSQKRLAHVLAATVGKQEARTAAIVRAALPARLVDAMGSSADTPLLFLPRTSVIVARLVGLCEAMQDDRAASLASRAVEAWETTMASARRVQQALTSSAETCSSLCVAALPRRASGTLADMSNLASNPLPAPTDSKLTTTPDSAILKPPINLH
jgi:hypothetical protein